MHWPTNGRAGRYTASSSTTGLARAQEQAAWPDELPQKGDLSSGVSLVIDQVVFQQDKLDFLGYVCAK